jgi:hypothetical protein
VEQEHLVETIEEPLVSKPLRFELVY